MENEDRLKIFDSNDTNLKLFGELLSNDSSRNIIRFLIQNESYTNEIAKKLDMRVSLVIHHLKKLELLDLLEITEKPIVRKGNDHRFFKMVPNLFIAPGQTREDLDKKDVLKFFVKDNLKITSIFGFGIVPFLIEANVKSAKAFLEHTIPVIPHTSITIGLGLVVAALLIDRIISKKREKIFDINKI